MKLVLSVEALAPCLTGIGRYTWELAQGLPAGLHKEVQYFRNGVWVQEPAALLREAPLHAAPRPWVKLPKWAVQWRNVAKCRGHVFHGPNFFLPACTDLGVATVHDLSVFKYPETHPLARIKHFEREFSASMARAGHLITDSEATRQEVMAFLGWPADKITAVSLGVSPRFAPASVDGPQTELLARYGLVHKGYALCVSTLEPRKKIGQLLQAYENLPGALRTQYPLVLVGGAGWLSEDLHHQIERLAAQGWLRYLGFVPESDLPGVYAGAAVFVYPSVYEGFGLPVLEAMASGVPVITSVFSSLPEVSGGAALLVDPHDTEALAQSIERGLCDASWQTQAAAAGLAVAGGFTWARCVQETVGIYQKLPA